MHGLKEATQPWDRAVKSLEANQRAHLVRWCGSQICSEPRIEPQEQAVEITRVDWLLRSGNQLVHAEFFKGSIAGAKLGKRMAGYLTRIWERYPHCWVDQHVVMLTGGTLPTHWRRDGMRLEYKVHLLSKADPDGLLAQPGTTPFAVLANAYNPKERKDIYLESLKVICDSTEPNRENLADAATTFAKIYLKNAEIEEVWKVGRKMGTLEKLSLEAYEDWGKYQARKERMTFYAIVLRDRFGDDTRIEAIAQHYSTMAPEAGFAAIKKIRNLDKVKI